jgi:HEPN domain-containing protein
MSAEIEREKEKIIGEWEQRAADDLESAELILKETDNYEIAAYHAHQAIEKTIKAELLKKGKTFKFIHDLNVLVRQLYEERVDEALLEKVSLVNSLYPILRYPTGDFVSKEQAEKSVGIAKEIFRGFR